MAAAWSLGGGDQWAVEVFEGLCPWEARQKTGVQESLFDGARKELAHCEARRMRRDVAPAGPEGRARGLRL